MNTTHRFTGFSRNRAVVLTSLLILLLAMVGCSTTKPKPHSVVYSSHKSYPTVKQTLFDAKPPKFENIQLIPDAQPKFELASQYGNKTPYSVWGKRYNVMPTSQGYIEEGSASWYGTKFHGRKTSSGEVYDVYGMTAAHKSLPLPTYLEVTNLENNRKVIVKVNDRGPFHGNRIIDLSYAAAEKLGYAEKGIARVRLRALEPATYLPSELAKLKRSEPIVKRSDIITIPVKKPYLQVGAFQDIATATKVKQEIHRLIKEPVFIEANNNDWHKVQIGPLNSVRDLPRIKDKLKPIELDSSLIVFK